MRTVARLVTVVMLVVVASFYAPDPASACSCVGPGDLTEAIGASQAAFVGKLIDRRSAGMGQFGEESIYVFEVETWVKGDLGQVIEIHSASSGAACGLEFWNDEKRIGAFLFRESGEIRSGLCSQVDPDVLLAAANPALPNPSLRPALLVASWNSADLTLLSRNGQLVGTMENPISDPMLGTQDLDLCPGGRLLVQETPYQVFVWDLHTYAIVDVYSISELDGEFSPSDISCRDTTASSIWLLGGWGSDSTDGAILSVNSGLSEVMRSPFPSGELGLDGAVLGDYGTTQIVWFDYESGGSTVLTGHAPDELYGLYAAANPSDESVAVMEVHYGEGIVDSVVRVVDRAGAELAKIPIPYEGINISWLDRDRILAGAVDYSRGEDAHLFVVAAATGDVTHIEGWSAWEAFGAGDAVYGLRDGHVIVADPESGAARDLTVLPFAYSSQLVVLDDAAPFVVQEKSSTSSHPTTPPLVIESTVSAPAARQRGMQLEWWFALTGIVIGSGIYVMGRRRRPSGQGDQVE